MYLLPSQQLGAGGLGCDALKALVMMGFRNIDIVDLDTVDYSNLNRQFLFRKSDVGKPKAQVAAEFIKRRFPDANITPHFCDLKTLGRDFYAQFECVLLGLDSIEVRSWANDMICSLIEYDDEGNPTNAIPIINGGSEVFMGSSNLFFPPLTYCFDCTLDDYPPPTRFQMCTIATVPRCPEHCVAYASEILFPKERKIKLDADNAEHMEWVYNHAVERAKECGIEGVTMAMTLGVVKNIVASVASTNAIVASVMAHEAFKFATLSNMCLDNNLVYNGMESPNVSVTHRDKNESCSTCKKRSREACINIDASQEDTLESVISRVCEAAKFDVASLKMIFMGTQIIFSRENAEQQKAKTLKDLGITETCNVSFFIDNADPVLATIETH